MSEPEEKNFRAWIKPIPEKLSEGKWDWRVTVERLRDGQHKSEKVSGGWIVAEHVAMRLMQELS